MMRRIAVPLLGFLTFAFAHVPTAHAQLAVNERWLTITTPHCRIHFTVSTEAIGRRAATAAERAYTNLARELVPPRGLVDVVITDAADGSNGSATTFPHNRIVINARPPVDQTSLQNYDDWLGLVLQHEMTHIFHLDRSRGWWRAAQHLFGRNPVLFPNYYAPSWLSEGLAVYYESRYTSGGRLEGSYQYGIARASALAHDLPRLDELALVTSRYPQGQNAYIYGSFIVDALAHRGGPQSVRQFIEYYSQAPIPFFLDYAAKRSFGKSFSSEWRAWRDSVTRDAQATPGGASQVTLLPGGGRSKYNVRWLDDSTVVYLGDNGRESIGLYVERPGQTPVRLERRSDIDVSDPAPDGSIVFAQADYINRIFSPSDLYETKDGITRRLTYNQRLSAPDRDGRGTIVAVQTAPGTTRLVTLPATTTVSHQFVTPLMPFALDTQWAAPRWSPDGAQIVAVRISGGTNQLVVLDSAGREVRRMNPEHSVIRSPSWSPDGRGVFYISDRSGTAQVYYAPLLPGSSREVTAMQWPSGIYSLDVRGVGRDPEHVQLAGTVWRDDGFHIATAPAAAAPAIPQGERLGTSTVTTFQPVVDASETPKPYAWWTGILPSFWSPLLSTGSVYGSQIGGVTSGSDVIGRHTYTTQALVNLDNGHVDAYTEYQYSRFVRAVVSLRAEQTWSYGSVFSSGTPSTMIGRLDQVTRTYALHSTFARPRVYTNSSLTLGAELETYGYGTSPDSLRGQLDTFFQRSHAYPMLVASGQFANTQRPSLSISPEDGIALAFTARQRWSSDGRTASVPSAVVSTSAYKSLDLPGFAHHVLAIRASAGVMGLHSSSVFSVGGVSGNSFVIVPGLTVGDQARTFPVRGFAPGTEEGNSAISASVEYRAPLTMPSRGLGLLPVFLDRTSINLFADAGKASCRRGNTVTSTPSGPQADACSALPTSGPTLASIGAELNLDTAIQFDAPYRFRLGVAHPVSGVRLRTNTTSTYVTLGMAF